MEITPSEQQSTAVHSLEINSRRGAVGPVAVKLGVFVVVTSIIAVGAYFGARAFLLNNDETSDDRRPVAVQRGTLLDDVTASGSVSFPELESLRFEIGGTVAELLVDEGADGDDLIVSEVAYPGGGIHADGLAEVRRRGAADAVDVGQRDQHPLLAGDVDS